MVVSKIKTAFAAVAALMLPAAADAAVFTENFDDFNIGRRWGVYDTAGQFVTTAGGGIEVQRSGTVVQSHTTGNHLELDSHSRTSNSSMAALVNLDAGALYEVSFAYLPRTNREGDNGISVAIGSLVDRAFTSSQELGGVNGIRRQQRSWQVFTYVFTAVAGENAIQFSAFGRQNTLGGLLDSIAINKLADANVQATPIPASALLFGTCMVFAFRRFKRA